MTRAVTSGKVSSLQAHFDRFRQNIVGQDAQFEGPYGTKKILYADWTASGRLYRPIEEELLNHIYPYVGNTHTETNFTGSTMTKAYKKAKDIVKKHVGAYTSDVLISSGTGMTGMVNKLQRILGLRIHEKFSELFDLPKQEKPVVFVSHMEHHSNQTSWLECNVDLVIIQADEDGLVCLKNFAKLLDQYQDRKVKIAAITSCSNVTGIKTPYHQIAKMIHRVGGWCFVDFACSAPYIDICMRPSDPMEHLDAIYFSPHKFLGGPGSTGVLIFCPKLYSNKIPDNPGGGTVDWTNPWGQHKYYDEIEAREDGGTPGFIQTIRVARSIQLKEQMNTSLIIERENEMIGHVWKKLGDLENLHILAGHITDRLGVISFYIDQLHYNLGVQLLNDRFGIQVRGGCSCAGTYGHFLLHVDQNTSNNITCKINDGDLSEKPGWIRMSIHPTMRDDELDYLLKGIVDLSQNHQEWSKDYYYSTKTNEFKHRSINLDVGQQMVDHWFNTPL